MKRIILFVITITMLCIGSIGCENYDDLVAKDSACDESWSNYEATLQRRSDLIPNLVAVVKGVAKHEEQTLEGVMTARASATQIKLSAEDLSDPDKVKAFEAAQSQLKGSLSRLMMSQEAYPELTANKNFMALQVQMEGTENRILRSREEYNRTAREYNTTLHQIHGQVVNKITGHPFKPRVFFSADVSARTAPTVSF